ncbi:MAG: hypothetical protein IKU15_03720 [Clostridia bacterium]|nr:hypothetical protein [Clostridia bacterium]
MIKAYVKNGVITLMTDDKKNIRFLAGTALIALEETEANHGPYSMFKDFNPSSISKRAEKELEDLYEIKGTTLTEKLFVLDSTRENKLYENREFKMNFELIFGELLPVYALETTMDLFSFELIQAASYGNILKKCECCGKFFFPSGRIDTIYCDRIGEDGYSCRKIGANRQYQKQVKLSDAKKMYMRVTRRNRYLRNKRVITEYEFINRKNQALAAYSMYKNGEISEDTLARRLSEDYAETSYNRREEISDFLL